LFQRRRNPVKLQSNNFAKIVAKGVLTFRPLSCIIIIMKLNNGDL